MDNQQSSYRQIMKATSLFGGVQIISILVSIIQTKFVAVLLGPLGMGIASLLNSTIGFIANLADCGLGTSAVKDVAAAYGTGNAKRVAMVVTVFRRWIWITGTTGMLVTVLLSPWLSWLTFGNRNYTFAFIGVAVTLLLGQISSGQTVLLRGSRRIGDMAKAKVWGSLVGLFVTLPVYYLWGLHGIVPCIILMSVISLFFSWLFARKIQIKPICISRKRTFVEGKDMLRMGFLLTLSGLITSATTYIFRIYLSRYGGVDQVGLYNAGFAMISTYVGLVFTAMSADYYPRLSAVANNNRACNETVNQQAEVAILILAPIILIFIVFVRWAIILFYSTKFIPINEMILWAALGILFKAASWPVVYIFLAKGVSKFFFFSELIANIYILMLNLIGYRWGGLTGLGISYLCGYFIYLLQVYWLCRNKYGFRFENSFLRIFALQLILTISGFATVKLLPECWNYFGGVLLIIISGCLSIRELNRRLDLRSMIISRISKKS
jgi:O-antigen/teichoic acid export membrane protein